MFARFIYVPKESCYRVIIESTNHLEVYATISYYVRKSFIWRVSCVNLKLTSPHFEFIVQHFGSFSLNYILRQYYLGSGFYFDNDFEFR